MQQVIQYFPQLAAGLGVTMMVALGSFAIGLMAALILAPLAIFGPRWLRLAIAGYVGLIRGLPELLIIFLIFYGGTVLLTGVAGRYVEVDALTAGIAALSTVSAAYLTEILRGALLSVPQGQWEAAMALGLRRPRVFRLVILPQMMRRALPGLGNQWLICLKDSALVSVVGLEELMRKSVIAAGATHEPLAFYLTAGGLYVAVTAVSTLMLGAYGRQLAPAGR
ncbi:ABC transporter permease [Paracoccus pacificus]|uniref:ABC transporter permease n=1 Tax=Paracoccus pacificus TaxID=1463598 RepID=A0ABW4R9W8_9RHOB